MAVAVAAAAAAGIMAAGFVVAGELKTTKKTFLLFIFFLQIFDLLS